MLIRVSPDILRNAAEQQSEIFNNMDETAERLNALAEQLSEVWERASGGQACDSLKEIQSDFRKLLDGSVGSVKNLVEIADAFDSVDGGDTTLAIRVDFGGGAIPFLPIRMKLLTAPGYVRVDPDGVREIAEQCRAVVNSVAESAEAFAGTINSLQSEWEGRAAARYVEESQKIRNSLSQIQENILEFAETITRAANRYEEIDNSLS